VARAGLNPVSVRASSKVLRASLSRASWAARVREFDLAELMAMLGEGDARRGHRNGDQRHCDVDTRFHL